MAFNSGYVALVSVNNNDISAYTEKVEAEVKRNDQKLPRLGGNPVARLVGPAETELKCEGWYDPALAAILFPLVTAAAPSSVPISYTPAGTGDEYVGNGYVLEFKEESDAKDPGKWSATLVIDGAWEID